MIDNILSTSKVYGTNAERLAMNLSGNQTEIYFYETDTGSEYLWKGSEWVQTSTDGSVRVVTVGGTTDYGPHPATYWTDSSATGAAAGAVYTLLDGTMFNSHLFHLSALTATSMDVYVSVDGTNFVGPVRLTDLSTNANFATSAVTAVGMYKLEGKFRKIRIDQVGVGALTVKYAHGWV